jgi:NhaC family Na+:H+ antiporter
MLITTVPAISIALILFLIIGLTYDFGNVNLDIENVSFAIQNEFNINPWLFLVPVLLFVIIIKKMPPLPALLIGTLLGAVFAIIYQQETIYYIAGQDLPFWKAAYVTSMKAMYGSIDIPSSNPIVDELFSTGGMAGMLNTIWLIISAMIFGGVMEAAGLLKRISSAIIGMARSTGSLIGSTLTTCVFFNITASDQYISIVVPGRMYAPTFRERGLKPEVLSRTLEDGGTVTSVLIPWNTGGATQARVLGVSTWTYLPFCFFNILSPLISLTIGFLNYKIRRYKTGEAEEHGLTEEERRDY